MFDCDGLLLDTEECWTRGRRPSSPPTGEPSGPSTNAGFSGRAARPRAVYSRAHWINRVGRELARELLDFCRGEVVEGAEPRPGAVDLGEALRGTVPLSLWAGVLVLSGCKSEPLIG